MFNDADENAFIREKRDLNQISEIRLIVEEEDVVTTTISKCSGICL